MVKIGKLWGDARFSSLSPISKLLYCYLSTQPSISTLGVVELNTDITVNLLGISYKDYKTSKDQLESNIFIKFIRRDSSWDTIVVIGHYKSLPKSKLHIRKAIDEGSKADPKLKKIFKSVFTKNDFEDSSFKPPTPTEVKEYALSLGHMVNGDGFCEYYGDNDWYDKNNKKVRNWKAKIRKVWCRDNNKLQSVDGAPKGYEHFFIDVENGDRVFPESWREDKPTHSNFIYAELLLGEFLKK